MLLTDKESNFLNALAISLSVLSIIVLIALWLRVGVTYG